MTRRIDTSDPPVHGGAPTEPSIPKRVTVQDIARQCGVAPSTVSNALTGQRFVQPRTRRRIIATAEKMGYRPSAIARALRLQRSWTIALMVADITSPTSSQSVLGIEDEILPHEYQLIICNTGFAVERETHHINLLLEKRIDGVIIMSSSLHDQNIARLQEEHVHLVLLSRRHADVPTNFVGVDNGIGIRDAVNHLYGLGHRRLAFIGGEPNESSVTAEKMTSFRLVLAENGLEPVAICGTDFSFEDARRAAQELFGQRQSGTPTAIIAVNDITAFGVMEAAFDAGLRIPTDMSIIGWDDALPASLRTVQLSTVRQPSREMGRAAAHLLLQQMTSDEYGSEKIIFPPQLIVRHTTAAAPSNEAGDAG
jgi:LacI family transcriptional regulator